MIKKLSLILSTVVFIIAIIIFSIAFIQKSRMKHVESKEIIQLLINRAGQIEKEFLSSIVFDQKCYFGKDSANTFMLRDICDTNKVFFYFSDRMCPPCIDNTISIIKEYYPNYQKDSSIIFISPNYPKRLADNCYGKKVLILQSGKIGLPIYEDYPFFFKLNDNLEVISAHIIVKVDYNRTKQYLQTIKGKSQPSAI